MAYGTPGVHTHQEWLGLVQPVGLVVAPVVLTRLGLFPESQPRALAESQRRLLDLLQEVETPAGEVITAVPRFEDLAAELLSWEADDLVPAESFPAPIAVELADYGDVLRPTHAIPAPGRDGAYQALVQELHQGTGFDEPLRDFGWEATPQQRFERLLKESEHPIGLLFNGMALRLIYAPRGESSGHITFPLEPMATVAGRPMLGALQLLLGVDRLFSGSSDQRLPVVLAASRKEQNEVSTRLAEQVLEALWELLLGFDAAERIATGGGRSVIGHLASTDPDHLYGGLITVLLRLVFLLYAEDEDLMPPDSLYGQHYSVSGLADRLRQERDEHQGAMESRRGAWASLLSLFRLVYDGGGADPAYLPARHGELFDPDAYPFLEGREPHSHYSDGILDNLPAVSDDVVEKVLSKLLWLDGERLSYRALDVEQIGSVYEGIMGFTVEQATGPSVGITYRPPRQKITITVVVNAEELLAQSPAKREKWLDEQAGVKLKLPDKVKQALKQASNLPELCLGLDKKLSPHTPRGLEPGCLILQPTQERRRSGSHYTPRSLTEPIVAEAFRPWLERCQHQPTAEQVLDLKVCDPAMGSAAFLVAACRFLAGHLVEAWQREGFPPEFDESYDKDIYARRLVAQRCLYGVDKNPFAVSLAKLSLWLVTLSKDLPFTFVDHALKSGDSLVGYSVKDIRTAMREVQLSFLNQQNQIYEQLGIDRRESFSADSRDDAGYDEKRKLLKQQIAASEGLRQAGDLMVAAIFDAPKPKERADKQQVYLAMLSGAFEDEGLQVSIEEIRDRLAEGERGIRPFHWDLEFPEVFGVEGDGFDIFVGNPPFLGGIKISGAHGESYLSWLQARNTMADGNTDLCGYFFRAAHRLLGKHGCAGMLATNTICQGDTRRASLSYICKHQGMIYSASKRIRWPGVAAVIVSSVHFSKICESSPRCLLDGREVLGITPFLLEGTTGNDPMILAENHNLCFSGATIVGDGFILDKAEALRLLSKDECNSEVLKKFAGGQELNESPMSVGNRYIINFGTMDIGEAQRWPDLLEIARQRVKPERDKKENNAIAIRQKKLWWRFRSDAPYLKEAVSKLHRCMALCRVGKHISISFQEIDQVFGDSLRVFALQEYAHFALLQCRVHEVWARFLCSSFKDDLRYSQGDCFENFPFPATARVTKCKDKHESDLSRKLEDIAEKYHECRSQLMLKNREGLTSTYNRFHDPAETSSGILELRRLHSEMDHAVLEGYAWSDVPTACGFGLDYIDMEEDVQLPDELQERIDIGELFFESADQACAFESQLRAHGGVKGRKKLPWRYRWPDEVRDEVLARLLALNAERYEEEQASGNNTGRQARRAHATRVTPASQTAGELLILTGESQGNLFEADFKQLELGS